MCRDDRPADEVGDEAFKRRLDAGRRLLAGRELVVEGGVAEAAREESAVLALLPVVEAVTAVVRTVEEPLGQRLGRDHLTAGRDDQALERPEQPAGGAVGGDDGVPRVEGADGLQPALL